MQARRATQEQRRPGDAISVGVRVRPLGEGRGERGDRLTIDKRAGILSTAENGRFTFERVFEGEDNAALFEQVGIPLVRSVLSGFNGTLLAYGQTGSGKTYTIGEIAKLGTEHEGVAHRIVRALYDPPPAELNVTPCAWSVQYVQASTVPCERQR